MSTLCRLCFQVPRAQHRAFARLYEDRILPWLGQRGLCGSAAPARPTVATVFARLLAAGEPAQVAAWRQALERDAEWAALLQQASRALYGDADRPPVPWTLDVYRAPSGPGRTVEVGPGLRRGLWQSFGVEDGLPIAHLADLCPDRHGHLWVATHGEGVCRCDGAQATTWTAADGLADDQVWALAEDGEGRMWCGTTRGVSSFDGQEWVTYSAADGLADDAVHSLLVDRRGRVWCGTGRGASRYDGQEWVTFTAADGLADDRVTDMTEDGEGGLWLGMGRWGHGRGVSRFDGREWVTLTTADGLPDDVVRAVRADRQGRVWCGTPGGVGCFDGRTWSTYSTAHGLVEDHVLAIAQDGQGRLWFGTHGGGVSRFDGARFVSFTVEDGLANDQVPALCVDPNGDLWAATFTGISRYCQGQFATFTTKEGLADHGAAGVGQDGEGRVWVGGQLGGLSRYAGASFAALRPSGMRGVWAIRQDRQGPLWLGTADGLYSYDGHSFTRHRRGPAEGEGAGCRALLVDRAGRVWCGTGMAWSARGHGLWRLDGAEWTSFTAADGLTTDAVGALAEDRQGRVWAGGAQGQVCVFDGERFAALPGLPPSTVTALVEDHQGCLWAATLGGGAWRHDGHGWTRLAVEGKAVFPEVTAALVDREGHLWVGTYGGGVYLYDGQVLQSLSRRDALVHDGVQGLLEDRDGDVWIATEGGVTRYRPRRGAPAVRLTDVIADRRYGPVAELEVAVPHRLVALEFRGRSWTTPPAGLAYVYRLQGLDAAWRTTYQRRVEYRDLPVARYTFEVRAVDRDLNYSAPAAVSLAVVPDPRLAALSGALGWTGEGFVGSSPALRRAQAQLERVARTDLTVLILGETGTGKGLAARIVHHLSSRARGPFVQVNCGALPEGLVESELFGHEKGAFTGAHARAIGKVELAAGGTLFLDEIGDLSAAAQAKVLQVLEERTFARVGSSRVLKAEVRVIAATNRDLPRMVAEGLFREDLYFRLGGYQVELPPLRQRREDLPALATYFATRTAAHLDRTIARLEPSALAALEAYAWPGNVRELEHVVQRAVLLCTGEAIGAADLALGPSSATPAPLATLRTLAEQERCYILEVLERTGWAVKGPGGATAVLGVPPSTLFSRMRKLGIRRP
ncbi:MAG: sigma 54-interacting transcriptional regulator, partial [Candidatus Latescibacterota bacterium]